MFGWLALQILVIWSVAALVVLMAGYLWRDMRQRDRPVWLRLVVIATQFPSGIGFVVWLLDLLRHPHDPDLSPRDRLLQRYRRS